ncbi:unnamed protein product, partial [Adineta steineri]
IQLVKVSILADCLVMNSRTVPCVRIDYSNRYPCGTLINKQIYTDINEADVNQFYLRFEENDEQRSISRKWTDELLQTNDKDSINNIFEEYRRLWRSRKYGSHFFDLHGQEFQNFAISLTNHMEQSEWRQLSMSKSHADRRILRSRVYAIGSRDDIEWNGKFIDNTDERKKKKLEMIQHLQSLELFDWFAPNCELHESNLFESDHDLEMRITRQGTQETIEELYQNMQNEPKLIAWVNFAASHNVCGSYSVDFGGSQEEEVATNCDGAVLLGTLGYFVETGLKSR